METRFGFTKLVALEFSNWLSKINITRKIKGVQQHHTWKPNYGAFKGNNHFEIQQSMKDSHMSRKPKPFSDIGQHFSIFPDGVILSGRDINLTPAGIYGNNTGYICIENIGDFDLGRDKMTEAQKSAIVLVTAELCKKFNLLLNTNTIVYHHWFDLSTGIRNNVAGNNKTCPGTNFYGGNKVKNCEENFLPLVSERSGIPITKSRSLESQAPTFESGEDYLDIDGVDYGNEM